MAKPAVFISSSHEGIALARELGRQLEAAATITLWPEAAFHPGKTVVESLTEVADQSDFAVFVMSADDVSSTRGSRWSPRPNAVFELGFLAGRLGLSRIFVVVDRGTVALPSDLAGTMYVNLARGESSDLSAAVAPAAVVILRAMATIELRPDRPIEYYSCFISYSWEDKAFAARLHDDLQDVGVRCWLDVKEMKVGDSLIEQIEKAIQATDKVLLVLSEASVRSSWVKHEIRNALQLERDRRKTVLFPIRLDDSVLNVSGSREVDQLKNKYICDFTEWHDKRRYQRTFSRLVRDLAISASVESEGRS
jgi:predicted nucleotide-binding protein